ncbi:MAG: flagellar export chaperone FliS [Gemmatimonadetes bacterium]|nr:flagellar export chaperone FliS [Gemmatimonadota bacterium]MCB9518979.1 flagellar export chaperone FliS [Gemmatimonadales bacterium]HPF62769.1 flagellar export chaperone FliS [Gemmatimonadales bacterium]
MTAHASADRYRQMDIAAMTPAQRIVALYGRLLLLLRQARLAIGSGDIAAREAKLDHASEILHELAASLDLEAGGELATRLAALYAWLIGECLAVHIRPDVARIDPMITVVDELHGAWVAVARQVPPPAWDQAG